MAIYTCGHTTPDSDSICSAISLAYLLNKIGFDDKHRSLKSNLSFKLSNNKYDT